MDFSFYLELSERSFPLLLMGVLSTIKIFFSASCLSFSLGLLFGVFCCNEIQIPFVTSLIHFITFVLRAVPFYVQLLIVYFVFPDLLGINLEVMAASIISLGI